MSDALHYESRVPRNDDPKPVGWAAVAVAFAGVVVTAAVMLRAGEPTNPQWWIGGAFFFLWAASPYVALALVGFALRQRRGASLVMLIGSLGVTGFGAWTLYDAFVAHLDPQSGLVFIFLPVLQWIGSACFIAVAIGVHLATSRRAK